VGNSAVKFSLEKSQVHNNCIKSEHLVKKKSLFSGKQIKDNKSLNLVKHYTYMLFVLL